MHRPTVAPPPARRASGVQTGVQTGKPPGEMSELAALCVGAVCIR